MFRKTQEAILSGTERLVIYALVVFVISCCPPPASAQRADSSRSTGQVLGDDGMTLLRGAGFILSGPVRWDGHDWILAGATVAGTGAAALLDDEALAMMQRNKTYTNDRISDVIVHFGDAADVVALTGGAYLAGLFLHERWVRETALLSLSAMLISGTVSTVTKAVTGRARPYMDLGNHYFKPLTFLDDDYHSFPSGHTIVAFSLAGVLAKRIDNPWATVVLYALATGTGASRMYTENHWFSDVVLGAATATAVSWSLVRWYDGEQEQNATSFRIMPAGSGVMVMWML